VTRPATRAADKVIERWEITVPGQVAVWTYDKRNDQYVRTTVGGKRGSKTLRISRDDRKYNEENIPDENAKLNPFRNGALRLLTDPDAELDTRNHYADAELAQLLEERDVDAFQVVLDGIDSELIMRRLVSLAEATGTVAQLDAVRSAVKARWPIGGTQKTIRDMLAAGEKLA
jgi:hypothetical protein